MSYGLKNEILQLTLSFGEEVTNNLLTQSLLSHTKCNVSAMQMHQQSIYKTSVQCGSDLEGLKQVIH